MEDLAAFSAREVKRSSSRGKRMTRVFLCRRTVRVKVVGKVIPVSFLKVEGRGGGRSLGRKTGERGTDRRIFCNFRSSWSLSFVVKLQT